MVATVSGIQDLANIKGEQISNIGSQDMTVDIMLTLAKRINELLAASEGDSIVFAHGASTTAVHLHVAVVGAVNVFHVRQEWLLQQPGMEAHDRE